MNTTNRPPVDVVFEQDFIVVYQALDAELCRTIIDRFDRDDAKWQGKIVAGGGDVAYGGDIKNSWDLEIRNEGPWQDIFQRIHPKIQACMAEYISRSPILKSFDLQASGYKIQMYPKDQGYFRWHADAIGQNSGDRVVAMVLYLNDVAKGGETEFYHQGIKVSPKTGYLVLFPPAWNYMHCAHIPESDNKYIIQTFIKTKG